MRKQRTFRAAIGGCPHTPADTANGRSSITTYLTNLKTNASRIDLIAILGDFSANQDPSEIASYATEGADNSTQLNGNSKFNRNMIYTIAGNHDSGDQNFNWYNRYIDDFGNNTAYSGVTNSLRPYPITGVENEYYSFQTGNILWLMMHDRNEGPEPWGRSGATGGHPSGSVTESTYAWWENMVANNQDKIIITCHHNLLKNTTIATGDNEGVNGGYHGTSGQPIASGRLENIVEPSTGAYEDEQTRFHDYLTANNGCIDFWFGAHTHYNVGETYSTRGYKTTRYGVNFINVGGLTRHHAPKHTQSKLITFVDGSSTAYINNMLHDSSYENEGYNGSTIPITLSKPFYL